PPALPVHIATRRRGGSLAARGARAAGHDAVILRYEMRSRYDPWGQILAYAFYFCANVSRQSMGETCRSIGGEMVHGEADPRYRRSWLYRLYSRKDAAARH